MKQINKKEIWDKFSKKRPNYDKEGNEIDEINFGRYVDCAYEAEKRAKRLIENYVNKYGDE